MKLRCRRSNALAGNSHDHRRIRGRMQVDGKSFAVAEYSGKYRPELATVYAKEAKRACDKIVRQEYKGTMTPLHVLAKKSSIGCKSS